MANPSVESTNSTAKSDNSNTNNYYYYNNLPPALIDGLPKLPSKNTPPSVDYGQELRIRGIITHGDDSKTRPSDWGKLEALLQDPKHNRDIEAFYIRGGQQMLKLAHVKDLNVVLTSLLSGASASYNEEDVLKVCLREVWNTIPLPWKGAHGFDLPALCPDLTFGHGRGLDLVPARLPRIISPFITPVQNEPGIMLPCVTVQAKGDNDEHIRHLNQHAAAIMLRNMAELTLKTKPTRLIWEMLRLENRISVLTVSVLRSSMVLTCHWLTRDPVLGHLEYHSRDVQSWDLTDRRQNDEGINCIFRAIQWVLRTNRPWIVGRLEQLMAD